MRTSAGSDRWRRAGQRSGAEQRRVRTSGSAAVALVVVVLTAVAGVACGAERADRLRPIEGTHTDRSPSGSPNAGTPDEPPTEAATPTTAPSATTSIPTDDNSHDDSDDAAAATVAAVLDRYDRAVTSLHADPGALDRPGDPVVAAWSATVDGGSVLAADVRSAVLERRDRGEVVRPPTGSTLSFVHHVTSARADGDGEISFAWCGWSPGVARDAASGTVTDDTVAHDRGTGTVRLGAGGWVLTALDRSDVEVLPAGTADPCTTGADR